VLDLIYGLWIADPVLQYLAIGFFIPFRPEEKKQNNESNLSCISLWARGTFRDMWFRNGSLVTSPSWEWPQPRSHLGAQDLGYPFLLPNSALENLPSWHNRKEESQIPAVMCRGRLVFLTWWYYFKICDYWHGLLWQWSPRLSTKGTQLGDLGLLVEHDISSWAIWLHRESLPLQCVILHGL
jgi:hypothetical protein